MKDVLHTIFPLAAKFFYQKYREKGGSQKQFAEKLGISKTYLSSLISGSRAASIELQSRIANFLYGPYDKFLAVGRRLMEGKEPFEAEETLPEDSVESLIARLTHYIIDHKKLTEEIEDLKAFYEVIVENLQSGVFVTDVNDDFIYINKFMAEHAGAPKEEIIGTNMFKSDEEFPKGEFSEIQEQYTLAKKGLKAKSFENVPAITPAGEQVYQSGGMTPRIKDGQFNGMVITLNDTTKLYTLFNILKANLNSSDIAEGIVAQSSPGSESTFFFLNKKMRKLVGQSEPEFDHLTVAESLKITSEQMKNSASFLKFVKLNFSSGRDSAKFIAEMKDGKEYEWSSNSLYDEDGKYWGRSSKARPIKRRKTKK
jgi:PAS domain S-box-containing protein